MELCPNCGEKTTMIIKLLGVNRLVRCICSCRKKELEQQEILEKQKELERRIDTLISQGIMDKAFLENTFENDNNSNIKVSNICKKYIENWKKMKDENIGILFYGNVGHGKKFYASCIANELFKNGVSICITSFPKMINKLMNFNEESNF